MDACLSLQRSLCRTLVLWVAAMLAWTGAGRAASDDVPVTQVPSDGAPAAVRSWLVCGTFPSPYLPNPDPNGPERAGFDADFLAPIGGERGAEPRAGAAITLADGRRLEFVAHRWNGPYIDLNETYHVPDQVCAYLYAELESAVDQVVYLHVGTNAAGKAWVGDTLAISHPFDRVAARSQNIARVWLRAGRTRLLLKVDHDGGGWGAFAEVYGRTAHRAFAKASFPRHFAVAASTCLPEIGDTVVARIANWIPRDVPVPVRWTIIDGGRERVLPATAPSVRIAIPPGLDRVIRIRARAPHPRGGVSAGECIVLAGGVGAARRTLTAFESLADDPATLTGARRDAYALARYAVERARRDVGSGDLRDGVARVGAQMALLHLELGYLRAGTDPYAGMTGMFEGAYLSDADGTAQPFTLVVPHTYPAKGPYALFINLHGASFTHELTGDWAPSTADSVNEERTIIASAMGRARYGDYRGLGEADVTDVLRWVTAHYRIDPDRIYLRGGSMGGMGTWRIASLHPDLFAGAWVDCGAPPLGTYRNLLDLPVYVNHGDADWSVPVSNARAGVDLMRNAGCPVAYVEYPGVDHAVGVAVGPEGYLTRLWAHRREAVPGRIHISAAHPWYGAMYWGAIERWDDPHAMATLDAEMCLGNLVRVALTNVARARLKLPPGRLTGTAPLVWFVNGRRLNVPRSPDGAYDVIVTDGRPEVRAHTEEPAPAERPYEPGATMNLYRGEPLLIVYGTTSEDDSLRVAIRRLAEEASHWAAPGVQMEFGMVPMAADTAVTDGQIASRNLLLLGGPEDNALVARIMPRLPVREAGGTLALFGAESIPLAGRGYGFVLPNPLQPRRLVLVYSSPVREFYTVHRGRLLSPAIAGLDPMSADVIVENVADPRGNQLVRQVWLTHGWRPEERPDEAILRRPADALEEAEIVADICRRAGNAEFAIVERPTAGAPCSYDTSTVWWRDRPFILHDVAAFDATGRELLELAKPDDGRPWMISPTPDVAHVDPAATYRVAGQFDLAIWGPASLRWNPTNFRVVADAASLEPLYRQAWGVRPR